MRAVFYKEPCTVDVEQVEDASIEKPGDAIIQITSAAICPGKIQRKSFPILFV